jgi:hypothetical protein
MLSHDAPVGGRSQDGIAPCRQKGRRLPSPTARSRHYCSVHDRSRAKCDLYCGGGEDVERGVCA